MTDPKDDENLLDIGRKITQEEAARGFVSLMHEEFMASLPKANPIQQDQEPFLSFSTAPMRFSNLIQTDYGPKLIADYLRPRFKIVIDDWASRDESGADYVDSKSRNVLIDLLIAEIEALNHKIHQ